MGYKNYCSEIENLWYGAVQLFVHMYRYFEIVELQYIVNWTLYIIRS